MFTSINLAEFARVQTLVQSSACVISIGSPSWFKTEIFPTLRHNQLPKCIEPWHHCVVSNRTVNFVNRYTPNIYTFFTNWRKVWKGLFLHQQSVGQWSSQLNQAQDIQLLQPSDGLNVSVSLGVSGARVTQKLLLTHGAKKEKGEKKDGWNEQLVGSHVEDDGEALWQFSNIPINNKPLSTCVFILSQQERMKCIVQK